MSASRLLEVVRVDLRYNLRRPLFWIWMLILGLVSWGLSSGGLMIQSGDSSVGGAKAFITSEFANAQVQALLLPLLYGFFIAIAAGMIVIRDAENQVEPVLHSTPLTAGEYIWGKFGAVLLSFLLIYAVHQGLSILFNHVLSGADSEEIVGPLEVGNYFRPFLFLSGPTILFYAGLSFYIGSRTRNPVLVFFTPLVVVLAFAMFLWNWSPEDLSPFWNSILMWVDPAGFRWINETYLKVDRGVDFYNHSKVEIDTGFLVSRLGFTLLGLWAVSAARRHFARTLRGRASFGKPSRRQRKEAARRATFEGSLGATPPPLAELAMSSRRPGFLRGFLAVLRAEFRALYRSPGMFLFVPLIIFETVGNTVLERGAFDTPLLVTSGHFAVRSMNWLSTLMCLMILFYTVESLRREEAQGLGPIYYASPTRTASMLFGKAFANSLVGVLVLLVTLATVQVVMLFQGESPLQPPVNLDLLPFGVVWGLALVPTFLLWSSAVMLIYSLTRNRYSTYGIALALLAWTGYELLTGDLTWVWNWPLWGALMWSDMGVFELVRSSLVLNRALALSLTMLFVVWTVKVFPRRQFDATRSLLRLRPLAILRGSVRMLPLLILPLGLGITLHVRLQDGFQGDAMDKAQKDYWRKYLKTWENAPTPDITAVDVVVDLFPEERAFHVRGHYDLKQFGSEPLPRFAVSFHPYWEALESEGAAEDPTADEGPVFTLNGEHYYSPKEREERTRAELLGQKKPPPLQRLGLLVVEPPKPMKAGDSVTLGFAYQGKYPYGETKNGGGAAQFVLPSGVVLHSFAPTFVPVIGFQDGIGVDDDNQTEPKNFPDDWYEGVTPAAWGAGAPYDVKMRVTAPGWYTVNCPGTLMGTEDLEDQRKAWLWETDHPMRIFNIVAGQWQVARGEGTALYYHPEHDYNVDEMMVALNASRKYYSEWYYPYPWNELKISEFPALAGYAQGFATNITFSEGIGFLTQSDSDNDAAFMVTAHEAAHQWWGNLLTPADGPGANILSEGMAHFSTLLLFEQVHGVESRIAFARQIEDSYGEARQADSERPMIKVDGSRAGDTTVTYDKGGWVFWMLLNEMGREQALAGMQSFLRHYVDNRDHAVLEDFVAHLREFAPDPEAYDAFCQQWFFDVVVPEYRLEEVQVDATTAGTWTISGEIWNKGTGRAQVDLCAQRGERFPQDEISAEAYRDDRVSLHLGADERQPFSLVVRFDPERLVVDPDALVLQLNRKHADHGF